VGDDRLSCLAFADDLLLLASGITDSDQNDGTGFGKVWVDVERGEDDKYNDSTLTISKSVF